MIKTIQNVHTASMTMEESNILAFKVQRDRLFVLCSSFRKSWEDELVKRDIVLYIAVSLDGYIARENGAVDWLGGESGDPDLDSGFNEFYSSIDTVVMGRTTYEQVVNELSPGAWVYEGKKCYVATSRNHVADNRVEYISEDIVGFIKKIKSQPGKDIWLVGGGRLLDQFFKQNLLDRYVITIIPTILGAGIPLFLDENPEIQLKLIETKVIDGMVELTYIRREYHTLPLDFKEC